MHTDFSEMFIVLASVNKNIIIDHKAQLFLIFVRKMVPNVFMYTFQFIVYNDRLLISIIRRFWSVGYNQFCIKRSQSLKIEKR